MSGSKRGRGLKDGASQTVVAATSPEPISSEDQVKQLQEQLQGSHSMIEQLNDQLNSAAIDLAVMRERYTEEINSGNAHRAKVIKLQQENANLQRQHMGDTNGDG